MNERYQEEARNVALYGLPAQGRKGVRIRIIEEPDGVFTQGVYCAHGIDIFEAPCDECESWAAAEEQA